MKRVSVDSQEMGMAGAMVTVLEKGSLAVLAPY